MMEQFIIFHLPRIRPLAKRHKGIQSEIETLEILNGNWFTAMPLPTQDNIVEGISSEKN
jgi:hypothetical protein